MNSIYVVQYFSSFLEDDYLNIVMEYCNRGDLAGILKSAKENGAPHLPEDFVWEVFSQVRGRKMIDLTHFW